MVDQKDVIRDLAAKANIAATSPTLLRAAEAMLLIMSQLNVLIRIFYMLEVVRCTE